MANAAGVFLCVQSKGPAIAKFTNLMTDRDRLMNADSKEVAVRTAAIFDRLQGYHTNQEPSVLATAAAFLLLCEKCKVSPQDAFTAAKNLMYDRVRAERIRHTFAAIQMHLADDYTQ